MTIPGAERIIVALDVPDRRQAMHLVDVVGPLGCAFKLGLELFCSEGPVLLATLRERELPVFVDLKLHDIPNTVAGAARALGRSGAWLLTVHLAGGEAMCQAALEGAALGAQSAGLPRPKVVGVTVLTSFDEQSFRDAAGVAGSLVEETQRRVENAVRWGLDGVVASPQEATHIRQIAGNGLLLVTPGIRPASAGRGDQVRTATPAAAIRSGADYIVVGRPVYQAADPEAALKAIAQEVNQARGSRRDS